MNVSRRTIRYDLDEIEEFIGSFNLELIRKPNYGIVISGDDEEKLRAYKKFEDFYIARHFLPAKKRQYLILYRLFQKKEPVLITELANLLEVSYATVTKDLDEVESWLQKQNLRLIRRRNYGVKLAGEEIDIRHGMKALLNETYKNGEMVNILNKINERESVWYRLEKGYSLQLEKILGDINLEVIEEAVRYAERALSFKFAADAFTGLILHIAYAISRLMAGQDIKIAPEKLALLKQKEEYAIAKLMGEILEEEFAIDIPEDELGFITLHLVGAKLRENANYKVIADKRLTTLTNEMIRVVEKNLGVELADDNNLFHGLILHLKATINRLLFDLPIENPLLDEIKKNYQDIFRAATLAARLIQSEVNMEISEDEIGYITLHFGAALERKNYNARRKVRVIVVCASGIGTANLLSVRLEKEFPELEIVDNMSGIELDDSSSQLRGIDFIISTVQLSLTGYDVLQVNPILTENDIKKIKDYLGKYIKTREDGVVKPEEEGFLKPGGTGEKTDFDLDLDEVVEVLSPYIEPDRLDEARRLLVNYQQQKREGAGRKKSNRLLNLMQPDLIQIYEAPGLDWEEALETGSRILLEQGYIEEEYIASVIRVVRENGPYIAIAPHVCFAHASPDEGVIKPAISLAVFKTGVKFNHEFDPIYYLFTLAPVDENSHLPALGDIIELINNQQLMEEIKDADSSEKIYQLLKDNMEQ